MNATLALLFAELGGCSVDGGDTVYQLSLCTIVGIIYVEAFAIEL